MLTHSSSSLHQLSLWEMTKSQVLLWTRQVQWLNFKSLWAEMAGAMLTSLSCFFWFLKDNIVYRYIGCLGFLRYYPRHNVTFNFSGSFTKVFWSIIFCNSDSSIVLNIIYFGKLIVLIKFPELIKWKEVNSHTQKLSDTIIGPLDHNGQFLPLLTPRSPDQFWDNCTWSFWGKNSSSWAQISNFSTSFSLARKADDFSCECWERPAFCCRDVSMSFLKRGLKANTQLERVSPCLQTRLFGVNTDAKQMYNCMT